MNNQSIAHRVAKRRRVNSSSTVQNQLSPRKSILVFDDSWLEALKHLTCIQWSKMSLVCRQINGIVQRNISRLPRQESFRFEPRFKRLSSIELLFNPTVYVKEVKMFYIGHKFVDGKEEARIIRCQSFHLKSGPDSPHRFPFLDSMSKHLEWLVRNVRSDSIHIPKWISHRIHQTVRQRAKLTNFIFETSQKCEAQELVFNNCSLHQIAFLNVLIEDFMALPVVQGTIPTVVIGFYPAEEEHRAHLGENLIGREVDSQGADALHVIENGKKRIRISFFCYKDYELYWYKKVYIKFYTI
ncbi:hypothetical protein Ddc_19477 [Ditylenchus destructor]|nr:hypothetical protein Ddc_19477 [Ditylenchus destructor]